MSVYFSTSVISASALVIAGYPIEICTIIYALDMLKMSTEMPASMNAIGMCPARVLVNMLTVIDAVIDSRERDDR